MLSSEAVATGEKRRKEKKRKEKKRKEKKKRARNRRDSGVVFRLFVFFVCFFSFAIIRSNRIAEMVPPPLFVVVVVVVVVSGDRVPVVFLIGFDFDDGRRGGDPSLFFFSAPSSRVEIFPICRGLIR